jgi:membrane protein implicated in regulation of membrane protease activity
VHVLLIILGLLLLLFGGGCTLIFLIGGLMDLKSMLADIPLLLTLWVPLGLLPLVLGWYLLRAGLRKEREKRQAKPPPPEGPSDAA